MQASLVWVCIDINRQMTELLAASAGPPSHRAWQVVENPPGSYYSNTQVAPDVKESNGSQRTAPSFVDLFTPKLITVLREGYSLAKLRGDAIAGLTVAIVALPLSMAIAIASGATPAQGLYTAIIGGFIVSMLSGSRYQVGGPAGAFIVLVASTVALHGMDGLILATLLSGIMLAIAGFLRLGVFIKFIPYPVTVGFTAGIAIIIGASQLRDFFGLTIEDEPGAFLAKVVALWDVRGEGIWQSR